MWVSPCIQRRKECELLNTIALLRDHLPASAPLSDSGTIARRHLLRLVRTPQLIVTKITSPVLFLLLFYFLFGGAIPVPGMTYVDYLVPAFFVQNLIFGGLTTASAFAQDTRSGLIDRLRSLPMARSAVLTGRALYDLCEQSITLAITTGIALLIGFRFHTGLLPGMASIGMTLLFCFAFFWVFAAIGLLTRNPEMVQALTSAFVLLNFVSSAYIPVATMPQWLQGFASNQPISIFIDAIRCLTQGVPAETILQHTTAYFVLAALCWCGALILVFGALALGIFRRL